MKDASDAILHANQAAYLEALELPRDTLLAKMEAHAARDRLPISDPEVASFLAASVRACAPTFIVELGTNIGYGAIVLARAAGAGAHVHTIENREDHANTARVYAKEAGLGNRITVVCGDAIQELRNIDRAIDYLYIDCVKEDYPRYLELAVPKLSPRGVIVADNVLWKGLVAADVVPPNEEKRVAALREFNRAIVAHRDLRSVILPFGDGVAFAVRV